MSFPFRVVEHVIPGQHIREHRHALRERQEVALKIAIKQYIPLDQVQPLPEIAVTIIGAHGNGFPKVNKVMIDKQELLLTYLAQEMYEPLWQDLYFHLTQRGIPIRAIWVPDIANQGASGVLNEYVQGDTPNWFDHSRDLLHMVNHFRNDICRPIIGVAHSMGCAQLIQLSIMHPRLLSTLVLYEPVMVEMSMKGPNPAIMAAFRRDVWPSREKAESALRKGFSACDPRVIDRYIKYGLRSIPTRLYNSDNDDKIPSTAMTLTTSKHQEVWTYTTPNLEPESAGLDDILLPDWDPVIERPSAFSRPEAWAAMRSLPHVRPSVLWVYGGRSPLSPPAAQDSKLHATGSGVGGSGGEAKEMVKKAVSPESTHLVVFEDVYWCAQVAGDWIGTWFQRYLTEEKFWQSYENKKSDAEMLRSSEAALKVAKMMMGTPRQDVTKSRL